MAIINNLLVRFFVQHLHIVYFPIRKTHLFVYIVVIGISGSIFVLDFMCTYRIFLFSTLMNIYCYRSSNHFDISTFKKRTRDIKMGTVCSGVNWQYAFNTSYTGRQIICLFRLSQHIWLTSCSTRATIILIYGFFFAKKLYGFFSSFPCFIPRTMRFLGLKIRTVECAYYQIYN